MSHRHPSTVLEQSEQGLKSGLLLRLRVSGESMAPFLRSGDFVVVRAMDASRLRRGDLVVVQREGQWVTHRLIGTSCRGWRLRGDNLDLADPPVDEAEIAGRVVAVEQDDRLVDMDRLRWRVVNTALGVLLAWEEALYRRARPPASRLARAIPPHWMVTAGRAGKAIIYAVRRLLAP